VQRICADRGPEAAIAAIGRAMGALLLCGHLATGTSLAASTRSHPVLACAAFDRHLLWQVEDAAAHQMIEPTELLAAIETIMAARRACRSGSVSEAIRIYEELEVGSSQVRWFR
jgi:hypothetical protein